MFKPVWPNHTHYVVYRKRFPSALGVCTQLSVNEALVNRERERGIERKRFGEESSGEGGRRKIMEKEGKEIVWGGERKENESRKERGIGRMKRGGKRERERKSEKRRGG